jgi:hypothetical protein
VSEASCSEPAPNSGNAAGAATATFGFFLVMLNKSKNVFLITCLLYMGLTAFPPEAAPVGEFRLSIPPALFRGRLHYGFMVQQVRDFGKACASREPRAMMHISRCLHTMNPNEVALPT